MKANVWIPAVLLLALVAGTAADRPEPHPALMVGGYQVLAGDFHVHSGLWSGGTLTPWGLVLEAERQGLDVLAIAGHNETWDARVAHIFTRLANGPIVLVGEEVTSPTQDLVAVGIQTTISPYLPLVDQIGAFVLYLQNLFEPIQQLSQLFNQLQASAASLHKLYGLLDERPAVPERPGAVDLPERGRLEVDHVSFAYGTGPPVLRDVTLAVEPGERLALVGPTGAGKSTLAKLMARGYDPTSGTVTYGGVALRDGTLHSLRRRIVVVPQEGFVFSGTIRDNLLVGRPDAGDEDLASAIEVLGLRPRFDAFPGGLDAEVRERGANLSAGERQLVSLVRAALADPGVLVLDEATSSLDPGTELVVEAALERLMAGRTVVVIAHRLSTAARADRVAVVTGGRLVEHGTHAELVASGGAYAGLFASWSAVGPAVGPPVGPA